MLSTDLLEFITEFLEMILSYFSRYKVIKKGYLDIKYIYIYICATVTQYLKRHYLLKHTWFVSP